MPKWQKLAWHMTYNAVNIKAQQLTDVEWTDGSAALPPPVGRKKYEIWHIGCSGQEIFLTDLHSKRSWTLYKGIQFNYKT